jgi:hypothetical protein
MKINREIPIPARTARGGFRKYPWSAMQPGDSFFVQGMTIFKISSQATHRAQKDGRKYTCRSVVENGESGVRVWRVK